MAQIHRERASKPQSHPLSEKFITVTFGLLVTVFSVLPLVLIRAFFAWVGGKTWEWSNLTHGFQLMCYVLLSAIVGGVILYLMNLVVIVKKLFNAFWESLEE